MTSTGRVSFSGAELGVKNESDNSLKVNNTESKQSKTELNFSANIDNEKVVTASMEVAVTVANDMPDNGPQTDIMTQKN